MAIPLLPDVNIRDKRVLLRLDLDLPEKDGHFDTTRLEDGLPTIVHLWQNHAQHVTVLAHRGRPEGNDPALSLAPIAELLYAALGRLPELATVNIEQLRGWLTIHENVRFDPREEKNDPSLAAEWAKDQDFYVNDAFATSHRPHTSIVGLPPLLPSALGLRFIKELAALGKVTNQPERPVIFVLGGAKLETKLPLIERVSHMVDHILLGGKLALEALETDFVHPKVSVAQLTEDTLDISDASIVMFTHLISTAKTIIWNGPMGKFEDGQHLKGTQAIAEAIQQSPAYSLVGGGDTEAALTQLGIDETTAFDHVSTGGGAMMQFLAEQTLPALEALDQGIKAALETPPQASQAAAKEPEISSPIVTEVTPAAVPSTAPPTFSPVPAPSFHNIHKDDMPESSAESAGSTRHPFGINGFGRIGRTSFRVWWLKHRQRLDLKLINTSGSMEVADWAMLLKYDSNYGPFAEPMTVETLKTTKDISDEDPLLGYLKIGDSRIAVTAQRDPGKIPWGTFGVDTVIESTGVFISAEKAQPHITAGAKKVIISAPPKGPNVPTTVLSVKEPLPGQQIISNASCTTNCIAPVVQVILMAFGIQKASMTTIHSYTDDQNLHDNSHKDLRRARAAALNIVPTSTGAAIATTEVIPELKGLFNGLAIRVPTPVGSLSDMVFITKRETTVEEVNTVLVAASQDERFKGILAVTSDPIVSSDIRGRSESSIIDLSLTQVIGGDLVKVIAWYDNEFGYCNRLVEEVGRVE